MAGDNQDNLSRLPSGLRHLIEAARAASANAWAPYSGLRVGAAALGATGRIYPGCNIENASYSVSMCAERNAVAAAVAAGEREIRAVAVAGVIGAEKPGGVAGETTDRAGETGGSPAPRLVDTLPPCGVCRQFLSEFGSTLLVVFRDQGLWVVEPLSVLFPVPFRLDDVDAPV